MHVDIFAGMTVAARQALLVQAQTAYGQLMTGQKPVSLSYTQGDGGKSISFAPAEAGAMSMFIRQLQQSLGIIARTRRPIRFVF